MFTVKFVGGAKKSFPMESLEIDQSEISIEQLIPILLQLKPDNTPEIDTDNVLIAVNGADSSAMDGRSTIIRDGDLVSVIPVIHGGASKKLTLELGKKHVQAMQIKGQKSIDVKFIDKLRAKYPTIILQAVSSEFILDRYHFKKIISLSLESQKKNILLSKKIETDILIRFALTTQISDAIKRVGLRPKNNFVLVAIGDKKTLHSIYLDLLPISEYLFSKKNEIHLKKHFKITKKHIDSIHSKNPLSDILVEQAAVLL